MWSFALKMKNEPAASSEACQIIDQTIQEALDQLEVAPDCDVSLMFSGGLDSTTTAILLGEKFRRIHLLTYQNGHGHYRMDLPEKRAKEIRRICGDKYEFSLISTMELFKRGLVNTVTEDYKKYESGFIWCMGCKLAMHTRSIIYNLENGIPYMSDGSSMATTEMVEQMPISVFMVHALYEEYGIEFLTPVYRLTREQEIAKLKEMGFRLGIRVKDRFLGTQPKCKPGEFYYLAFLLFNKQPKHEVSRVSSFIIEKGDIARREIRSYFEEKGLRVEDLIDNLKQKRAGESRGQAAPTRISPPT